MTYRILIRCVAAALVAVTAAPVEALAQELEYEGAAALGLALRRVGTVKRVLMIAAHPDDESTQILSTLALGDGATVGYLSLTRGEGGQNSIGAELGEALGILRTEELLAARSLDGARQFFTRAYDYGYSRSADEAFRHWPRDSLVVDAVSVIRRFRPDLVISIFTGTTRDGHGQHQAAGIVAREAYQVSGDRGGFPGLAARGLEPHTPAKLYLARWSRTPSGTDRLFTGELDPLFGRSHYQIAMASRSRHRSQDMGRPLTPGPQSSTLELVDSRVPGGASGLFAGVDTTVSQVLASAASTASTADFEEAGRHVRAYEDAWPEALDSFNPLQPEALVRPLSRALAAVNRALDALPVGEVADPVRHALMEERQDLSHALVLASRVQVLGRVSRETVAPGESFDLLVSVWNGGENPVRVTDLKPKVPGGWRVADPSKGPELVPPNTLLERRFSVEVAGDATPTKPYFLAAEREGDIYRWTGPEEMLGRPFEPDPVSIHALLEIAGVKVEARRQPSFTAVDRRLGEVHRPLRVVPAITVELAPGHAVLPLKERRALRFSVAVRSHTDAPALGEVRFDAPPGWRVEPRTVELEFSAPGQERTARFEVRAPEAAPPGQYRVSAAFETEAGRTYSRSFSLVDYPHIRPRPIYEPARTMVAAIDVEVPDVRVGYIAGPGDEVPIALQQLGLAVEEIDPATLAAGDLGGFDVIVTGIRAYEVRPDVIEHNPKLLEYVRKGGTLIVQYNKYEFASAGVTPYPLEMNRPHDRVADETAPVRLLDPDHPVLSSPNRITQADFEGWVQERGLYFPSRWDPRYTPVLEMADPGEQPLEGAILIAPYGDGTYVYTGLAFFRQLPAGVPGAYRLFANLLALGADR